MTITLKLRRHSPRRHLLAATTALALVGGTVTACGSDSDDADASGDNSADTVSVTHSMGTTEVPKNPEKVVSFSAPWTDAFSALDNPVNIEYRAQGYEADLPWARNDSGTVESYNMQAKGTDGSVAEKIAAADPDVIFAGWVPDQATYDTLNEIAPTVAVVGDNTQSDDWRDVTELAGDILDKKDEATDLVENVEKKYDETRKNHPGLEGATAAFGQASPQGIAVVTADNDPANEFLTDLGMVIPEDVKKASQDGARAFISEENTDLLNTDFLAMWTIGTDPTTIKGWQQLNSVKSGADYLPDSVAAMSLSQPSALSVPWAVDQMQDNFTAVDKARGK
jgi:iron complex transport system substrate-binding protein